MTQPYSEKIQKLLRLPGQMPWLGPEEKGFLGTGLVGCGTDTHGVWYNLVGTAYSMESFIRKERLKAIINNEPHTLNGPMHRAAGTGVYYSTHNFHGVVVYVVDFAIMHKPYATRLIAVHNGSGTEVAFNPYAEIKRPHQVSFHADMKSASPQDKALTLVQEQSWLMTLKFTGEATAVRIFDEETEVVVDTSARMIQPDEVGVYSLYHYAHRDGQIPREIVREIDGKDGVADLHECINEWTQWLQKGRDLDFVKDERARQIIESSVVIIRMEQGEKGGIMATPGGPTSSYVRDNHSSLRGMMAAGHTDEAKKYLHYANEEFSKLVARGDFGIPTAFPIGLDKPPFFGFGNTDNWSCETPGLYVLTAMRYYELTEDLTTLKALDSSLRYAIKVQLDFARTHDWKLIFNGDETESGGCGITMTDSVTEGKKWYSMASLVICIASLRFLIEYLTLIHDTVGIPAYRQDLAQLEGSLDENFWSEELGLYRWYRRFDGTYPTTMMTNFQIMPLYFGDVGGRPRAERSTLALKPYITERGFIPNQPMGENRDFCGHNMGYLLNALTELNDPLKDVVYDRLINGGTVGCWGMWGEAYFDDGMPYGFGQTWDNRAHNLRPFESGTNIEAIIKYWDVAG